MKKTMHIVLKYKNPTPMGLCGSTDCALPSLYPNTSSKPGTWKSPVNISCMNDWMDGYMREYGSLWNLRVAL